MTERFDEDVRRAFQEHNKSLAGWEFTPAMQQRVLQRIRAEEAGAAAAPERKPRRLTVPRPLLWATVAAAAFLIVLRVGTDGLGGASRKAPSTASAPSADKAAAPAAAPQAEAPAGNGATANKSLLGATQPTAPNPPAVADSSAFHAGSAPFELTLPAPAQEAAPVAAPSQAPRMMVAAPSRLTLAAAPAAGEARDLSLTGVRALDSQGSPLWERPLPGITDQSLLAVSADGHSAVSAGTQVYVLSPTGEQERVLTFASVLSGLTWSEDGRLAAVIETGVAVYRGEVLQYRTTDAGATNIRFGPDGALAALSAGGAGRKLTLYDYAGNRLMQADVAGSAHAVAFSPDGNVLLAGSQAFDRTGRMLWQAPLDPDGAAPWPGTDRLLLWNGATVQAVDAADGAPVWQAHYGRPEGIRGVSVSPDGGSLAIAGATDTGGGLWVLDGTGRQLLAEATPAVPSSLTFVPGRLLFLMDRDLQMRQVAP